MLFRNFFGSTLGVQVPDIEIIGAQFAAEAVQVGTHFLFSGRVGLRE